MPRCDHCLIEFPEREAVHDEVKGEEKVFCCHGCQGVYRLINDEGLDDFYKRRKDWVPGPAAKVAIDSAAFSGSLRPAGDDIEVDIILDGIRCASCVWLNERVLQKTGGVTFAQVNYATHRARIRWDPRKTGLDAVLHRITSIGYTPKPFVAGAFEEEQKKASRDLLIRFGTASFFSMQQMIYSAALYAGYFQGIEAGLKDLFHWISLALTTPVLFYAGWPFLKGALRGIRHFTFNMDVLIIAGAGSAYVYSIYQMFAGGEVYFDTSAMIITLILLGRFIEAGAKRKASEALTRLLSLAPREARKVVAGITGEAGYHDAERVMTLVSAMRPGDLIEVLPGEKVPLDGIVRHGASEADESMLTGESHPVSKTAGAEVFGGTVNLYGAFIYEVTRIGNETVLARIIKAVEDAQARRAPVQAFADKVVGIFVPLVLLISFCTATYWWLTGAGASVAVMNAVSVLVIACPCALGLATPLAILIGTSYGASKGVLIKGGDVIERARKIDLVVFDKTGTITLGKPALVHYRGIGMTDSKALALAASLERYSEHSLGKAIVDAVRGIDLEEAAGFSAVPGKGIQGTIDGKQLVVGNREFALPATTGSDMDDELTRDALNRETAGATVVYLSCNGKLAGIFAVSDVPRSEAREAMEMLARDGLDAVMITGDAQATADAIAHAVGIGQVKAKRTPLEKAADLKAFRDAGRSCAMVGDGINDAPALVEAEVGIAMGRATDIALESADMVLMRSDLRLVSLAVRLAKRTYNVIKQNLFWAFFYNVVTIPLAVMGILHPIVAAAAMALSSLSVVGNSLRAKVRQ
ncbi:MAG: heavy metal translocating P-type ATPase [Nitrospirota bacterium]|nr:heavy metal translocating P-type ATPase [Nitrospirota bacterium]